jgi:hypothetical protein
MSYSTAVLDHLTQKWLLNITIAGPQTICSDHTIADMMILQVVAN